MSNPTQGIVLYYSSVAGNVMSEKNTERARFLLQSTKLPFAEIDVSLAENTAAKEYMKSKSQAEVKTVLPQIFVDGEYKGLTADIDEWNEFGELASYKRTRHNSRL